VDDSVSPTHRRREVKDKNDLFLGSIFFPAHVLIVTRCWGRERITAQWLSYQIYLEPTRLSAIFEIHSRRKK
jgi:hypothetical protein